jgi:ammonium transporter, Amt family
VAAVVFSFVGTYVILKLVDGLTGLRVTPDEEATGLDLSQHSERAYS